nr:hypothetical protein [Saccharothrix texasensis]
MVREICAGPTGTGGRSLWSGLPKGADFAWPAKTAFDEHGGASSPGFPVAVARVRTFLAKRPDLDATTITYERFTELFRQAGSCSPSSARRTS